MLEIIFSRNEAANEGQLLSIKSIDRMDSNYILFDQHFDKLQRASLVALNV